jgi:hypothetical protein
MEEAKNFSVVEIDGRASLIDISPQFDLTLEPSDSGRRSLLISI